MSIFDEVSGRYRAPRLEDLPPPPEPSIWRKAQQGLSEFMDSPWGAAVEVPLTVATAPQRAVEAGIGALRGGFELSEEERQAYGREAYDRDAAVQKFGGGESAFETVARRLRGRGYTAPDGGQIARETIGGAGELLGAPTTATVMGLSRDPSQAGGYRPISASEQETFNRESPVLSRVAAPLRVGVDFAGSVATDPTSLLMFGPKLLAKAGGTIAKEAAEAALKSAALETAKAERLAARLFVPGAAVGALGGTLEAGRAISEDGAFSPQAIEATLGAGLSAGMGALAAKNAFHGLEGLPKPPGAGERSLSVEELPPPPQMRPFDVPAEPDRYAYRARTVGEQGIPATGHAQASLSEQDVRRMAPSRTGEPQEVTRVDLKGLDPSKYEIKETPSGEKWVRFRENLPEDAVQPVGPIDAIDRAAADKATPPVRAAVESADVADLAQATGLTMERAQKGAEDVRADGVRELSPEAVAIKKTVLQSDPAMLDEAPKVDLRSDPTEPLPERKLSVAPEPDEPYVAVGAPTKGATAPDTPEFRDWFGGSKVVDSAGAPQRVFHGMAGELEGGRFADRSGNTTGNVTTVWGSFFTPDAGEAGHYADMAARPKKGQSVTPAYLSLKNPYEMPYSEFNRRTMAVFNGEMTEAQAFEANRAFKKELEAAGHDGIVMTVRGRPAEYVAFKPEQIKSAIGNRGSFDPTNPDIRYSAQAKTEAQSAVTVDHVRKAFPTGKITDNEGAWEVKLPGNRNIRVTPTGEVAFSLGELQKGHPDAATAEGLAPGMQVVGSWQRIGRGGLISLAKEAGQGTLDHETFHAAMDLVLSEREKKAVLKRFKTEEAAADAYGAWTPAEKSNAVFAKMAGFFQKLYRSLFPNADSVFGKVRTGEAFGRTGTAFEEKALPPIQKAEPIAEPARPPEKAPTNYREFLDSNADEVPAPPKPAEFPPVTGRSMEPGEAPRVENRVDDTAAATADANVPELPLDRDTVQSWESLDPKVKKILRTYDEQTFYDTMKTRNLDAAETQAFDAVIKGKSERLERLKTQERTPETDREIASETLGYIAAQRAYINDGTGLARALAARARVMSAGNPAEAFARKVETFKIPKAKASNIVAAFKRDPGLLEALRARSGERKLSVVEGPTKFAVEGADPLHQRMIDAGLTPEEATAFLDGLSKDSSVLPHLEAAVNGPEDTEVLLKKVFKEIKGVSDEQAAEILAAFKENPDNLAPLLQSALGAGKLRKVLEFWRAGMLTAVSTDIANLSGNVAEHHARLAETGLASKLDWVLQQVYGGDRARFSGEMGAEMAGANMAFGSALKNAAKNMLDVVTLKDKPIDMNRRLEHQVGAIGGTFGKIVRAAGYGRLEVMDAFQKEWGGSAEAGKLTYRKAANELPAGSTKAEIKARQKEILAEFLDPSNDKHMELFDQIEKSKEARTFQDKVHGSLTDGVQGVVRRNPWLSFALPFIGTPGRIAAAIIRRSPLGVFEAKRVYNEFRVAKSAFESGKIDAKAFAEARGKLADAIAGPLMGTSMLAGFMMYANAGGMTGSGPTDDRAKNALKESGWSPYSFVFTDPTTGKKAYVPFNRFEPVSSLLGFAADMAEVKNFRNLSLFDKVLGSVVENLSSKTYLSGLADAASLIAKPKEFAPQYIKGFVGSFVPNIIGRTAATIDPIQRDTRSSKSGFAGLPEAIGKNIQSRIPFASQMLPARISSTGQPVERAGNAFTRFASPVQPTIEKPERFLETEYGRLGWAPTSPSRNVTVRGVHTDLNDREFDTMVKATRRASDEARNLIRSPHYKSLPDDQRELLLDRIYSKWKARGRQSIRATLERRVAREARP